MRRSAFRVLAAGTAGLAVHSGCPVVRTIRAHTFSRRAVCRDRELAKFEAFLNKEQCMHINALVRARSRLAYPMKG
jgi:hypothetical protein